MSPGNVAIIGGTGFEQLPPEIFVEGIIVETGFGSVPILSLSNNYVEPYKLFFLSRHGESHGLAPHQINYQANIAALKVLDVQSIFATNAVGSLRIDLTPGTLVLLDDFIDFTRQRPLTHSPEQWQHTDFSEPYSNSLRKAVLSAASLTGTEIVATGTYVCCDGPRFESPAEVRLFAQWGGDVVGMTGLPEAIFAREAGIDYAALAIVTNLGAGLSDARVSHAEVVNQMHKIVPNVRELLILAGQMLIDPLMANWERE